MKKFGVVLSIISTFCLIGCNQTSQNDTSIELVSSSSFSSSESQNEIKAPKDVEIYNTDTLYDFTSFYLEEYQSELTIQEDNYLYLGSSKLSILHPFALFAADINHDGYRELLYEKMMGSASTTHTIFIHDIHHDKELFKANEQQLGRYMHRFGLVDEQLMINLCPFNEFMNADISALDYSPIVLNEQNDLVYTWQNKYGIESLMLVSIQTDDDLETINPTKIDNQDVYKLSADKSYKFTIKMNKLLGANSSYPESDYAFAIQGDIGKHYSEITHENGVYTFTFEFSLSELTQIVFCFIDFSLAVSLIVE